MAITTSSTYKSSDFGGRPGISIFTVTIPSGTSYVTGGLTVDITANIFSLQAFADETFVILGSSSTGHDVNYVKGVTLAAGKFQLFVSGGTAVAAGALAATIVITAVAIYGRNNI